MLHIKTSAGKDAWLNLSQIVSIEPSDNGGSTITTTARRVYGGHPFGTPCTIGVQVFYTPEAPTDLLVRLRVELGGAK